MAFWYVDFQESIFHWCNVVATRTLQSKEHVGEFRCEQVLCLKESRIYANCWKLDGSPLTALPSSHYSRKDTIRTIMNIVLGMKMKRHPSAIASLHKSHKPTLNNLFFLCERTEHDVYFCLFKLNSSEQRQIVSDETS